MISKDSPVIGISMRRVQASGYEDPREALSTDWFRCLQDLFPQAVILPIPNIKESVSGLLANVNFGGMILSNGNDIGSEPERDETERMLLNHCLEHDIPLIGVCRGFQFVLGEFGVPLCENVEGHVNQHHQVTLVNDFFKRQESSPDKRVNSFHNQGVLLVSLKDPLKPLAKSSDGLLEGFYHQSKPLLAIQWHVERPHPDQEFTRTLLRDFFHRGCFWNNDEQQEILH
jgi:gamma-glutamyl-gamma-aminobutyrate hydrolase PuuD